jgi:hypothetical protein
MIERSHFKTQEEYEKYLAGRNKGLESGRLAQEQVYNEIKEHILGEVRYWLAGIKAGVPVDVFERRVRQIEAWEFGGGEGDLSVLEEFAEKLKAAKV